MALFDGVENFTPVFTGKQLAIAAGQGAGQSIARGMASAREQKKLDFLTDTTALDQWAERRKSALKKSSKFSTGPAVPWDQMPIPDAMPMRPTTPSYGGIIGSGGPLGMGIDTAPYDPAE